MSVSITSKSWSAWTIFCSVATSLRPAIRSSFSWARRSISARRRISCVSTVCVCDLEFSSCSPGKWKRSKVCMGLYPLAFDLACNVSVDSGLQLERGALRRYFAIAICATLATASTASPDSLPLPSALNILGVVTAATHPVEHALVIALNLNTLEAMQTFSGTDGAFALPKLPAAVYRVIAVKQGFLPTITMIVPTKPDIKVAMRLENEKHASK